MDFDHFRSRRLHTPIPLTQMPHPIKDDFGQRVPAARDPEWRVKMSILFDELLSAFRKEPPSGDSDFDVSSDDEILDNDQVPIDDDYISDENDEDPPRWTQLKRNRRQKCLEEMEMEETKNPCFSG